MKNHYPSHLRKFLENEVLIQFFSSAYKGSKTLHNRTVNGLDTMTINLVQDGFYYFRLSVVDMNIPVTYVEFYPEGACETRAVAYDGVYRSKIPHEEASNLYMVTVSSRLDLSVSCNDDAILYYYQKSRDEHDAVKVSIQTTKRMDDSPSSAASP